MTVILRFPTKNEYVYTTFLVKTDLANTVGGNTYFVLQRNNANWCLWIAWCGQSNNRDAL